MTKDEAVKALDEMEHDDPESAHHKADSILLEYLRANGGPEIVEAYDRLTMRCAWWAWA